MRREVVMLSLLVGILVTGNAFAEHEEHPGGTAAATAPESISGIWAEIEKHQAMLKETIEAGKLEEVHKTAFEIRDLVNALAGKSATLTPENLENVKTGSERVAEIANLLDKYGDAKDQVNTTQQFERLSKALDYIKSQYSPEVLKEHKGEEHAGKKMNM